MTGTETSPDPLTDRQPASMRSSAIGPGPPALAVGQVWHRRNRPALHEFDYPVKQVWLDPDRPQDLFGTGPLRSGRGPRPIRFRPRDYLNGDGHPFGPTLRNELAPVLGTRPTGPIRILTQPRTWGWLFNPITVYLVWPGDDAPATEQATSTGKPPDNRGGPCGAILEVTNTPWKERLRYAVPLDADGGTFQARFDKKLHVSPFLDEDYRYRLTLDMTPGGHPDIDNPAIGGPDIDSPDTGNPDIDRTIELGLDVLPHPTSGEDHTDPIVETRLRVQLLPPTRRNMKTMVLQHPFPTHRVSLGIHWQAARLATKRVPFIAHPGKRS